MTETLLHFVWKYRSYSFNGLTTQDGEKIEIIDAGIHNTNSGPDFFNSKIKLDNTIWVGNIEMHINSSDWYSHGHQSNKNYDNVILHVVINNDKQAISSTGISIPTLKINFPVELENELLALTNSGNWIPCAKHIQSMDQLSIKLWVEKLMIERLEQKNDLVNALVSECKGRWEEAFYRSVVRCFGLKVNTLPAELLAKATPLNALAKHKDNLFQLESILFGQAGLLENAETEDEYLLSLKIEYNYLQRKFHLKPIDGKMWKFMRLRPAAFPTIRLAQLAMLIHKSSSLFSKSIESVNYKDIEKLFLVDTSEYWQTHYVFGKQSQKKRKLLGKQTVETIILNSVVPFLFVYGEFQMKPELKEKSIALLEQLPPEKNSIIEGFKKLNVESLSAYDSQALLYLKTYYCDTRKCIFCPIGSSILLKSNISLEQI